MTSVKDLVSVRLRWKWK